MNRNRWYWFLRVHNRTKKAWKWVLCAYEHNEHSVRVLAMKMRLHSVWVDRSNDRELLPWGEWESE